VYKQLLRKGKAMRGALDFAVIGAQKSGTTSLCEYLEAHPRIYVPPEKEIPFFARDYRYEKGWEWYAQEYFSDAPEDALWGTVTPQYMADPRVPQRMFETMPEIKLIALLRNPVYRAVSQYKMAVKRGMESRTLERAIEDLADGERARRARGLQASIDNEPECYLAWGEYARILGSYRSLFPEEQVLVLFSEDLEDEPREAIRSIMSFLGLPLDFTPPNLGRRYHAGGMRRRIKSIDKLRKVGVARRLWRLLPKKRRRRLFGRIEKWNVVPEPPTSSVTVDPEIVAELVDYFRPEVERLRVLLGREVPWPEFR
jgi:hypothetical protein